MVGVDWYFWFPLYACACVVNMVNWAISSTTTIMHVARVSLLLGLFLFIKVVMEDFVNEIAGFWSLNLSERVVREKIGSGLVVISLILQLEASLVPEDPMRKKKRDSTKFFDYGETNFWFFFFSLFFLFNCNLVRCVKDVVQIPNPTTPTTPLSSQKT